jgi:hypothetical protein
LKKTKESVTEFLAERGEWWIDKMGLKWWRRVTLNFIQSAYDFAKLVEGIEEVDERAMAYAEIDWGHMVADIFFNVELMVENDEVDFMEIEASIVHELVHLMVEGLQKFPDDEHNERTTTQLARAFIWVRNGGRNE